MPQFVFRHVETTKSTVTFEAETLEQAVALIDQTIKSGTIEDLPDVQIVWYAGSEDWDKNTLQQLTKEEN